MKRDALRSKLLKNPTLKSKAVTIDGEAITVRELTAGETRDLRLASQRKDGTTDEIGFAIRAVIATAANAEGETIFEEADLDQLLQMPVTSGPLAVLLEAVNALAAESMAMTGND